MKYTVVAVIMALTTGSALRAQSIVGTWQQTETTTCFAAELKESPTEQELLKDMGDNSSTSVAKLIRFDNKGRGDEAIFSAGKKKPGDKADFQYKINGNELMMLDKKSGIITMRFVIDELTESTLRIHDAVKDCETRSFARVK